MVAMAIQNFADETSDFTSPLAHYHRNFSLHSLAKPKQQTT